MASPADNGVVSIFSSAGKRSVVIPLGKMESGVHKHALPELAAGFYVLYITIDKSTTTWKQVSTGDEIVMSNNVSGVTSGPRGFLKASAGSADTLVAARDAYKTVKKAITSHIQTGIAIVMEVVPVKDLPIITEMPDPLTMKDGTKVTTLDQWNARRREMIRILEDYEYGHMPPPPGNVKTTVATPLSRITVSGTLQADYRMPHLTFGPGQKLGFDLGIFTPVDTVKRHPVLINLGYGAPKQTSLGTTSAALTRGYAVANIATSTGFPR